MARQGAPSPVGPSRAAEAARRATRREKNEKTSPRRVPGRRAAGAPLDDPGSTPPATTEDSFWRAGRGSHKVWRDRLGGRSFPLGRLTPRRISRISKIQAWWLAGWGRWDGGPPLLQQQPQKQQQQHQHHHYHHYYHHHYHRHHHITTNNNNGSTSSTTTAPLQQQQQQQQQQPAQVQGQLQAQRHPETRAAAVSQGEFCFVVVPFESAPRCAWSSPGRCPRSLPRCHLSRGHCARIHPSIPRGRACGKKPSELRRGCSLGISRAMPSAS